MQIFCNRVQNDSTLNNQVLKAEYNVFIIGFQQSGKSTLANLLSDQKQLDFEKNGNLYNPINQHYFPISSDNEDPISSDKEDGTKQSEDGTKQPEGGTQQPKFIIMQDFQIWDFPGYGIRNDSKTNIPKKHPSDDTTNDIQIQQSNDDSTKDDENKQIIADDTKDIENRIQQVILMNQASASHIIMVFPYSQFTQDRAQNIIQIINLIAQKDLPASIIISKVPKKMKLKNIIEKLEAQLSQEEVIYTDQGKDLLRYIISNKRIQILNQPQLVGDNYQFEQECIEQIKKLIFNKEYFNKIKIQFSFLSDQQLKINQYAEELQDQLQVINQQFLNNTIQINISKILRDINDQQLYENQSSYEQLTQQKNKQQNYYQLLQQICDIPKKNEIIDQQINKINDFFAEKDVKIMQNTLYITCASYNLSELKKIYESNNKIEEIYINSFYQFIIDCDIKMTGVQIYIKCKQFKVLQKSFINLKGLSGQSFQQKQKARNGDITNIHGEVGKDGNQGGPGGIFYVDAKEYFYTEKLTIDVSGGDGGNGQDGGDGFDGQDGEDGKEEEVEQRQEQCLINYEKKYLEKELLVIKIYHYLSAGKLGQCGGNAGSGGLPGQQGQKGIAEFAEFKIKQTNLIDDNSIIGLNGINGIPGKGGQQGIDYIGIYSDAKSYAPELAKETIKNMSAPWIGLSVLLPNCAIGYFAGIGIKVAKSVTSANNYNEYKILDKIDVDREVAPQGIVMNKSILKQQTIDYNQDLNLCFKNNKGKLNAMYDTKLNEIRNQFLDLQFSDQTINFILNGAYK